MKKFCILLLFAFASAGIWAENSTFYTIKAEDFTNYIVGPSDTDSTKYLYKWEKPVCVMICIDGGPALNMYHLLRDYILPDYGQTVNFFMIVDDDQYSKETLQIFKILSNNPERNNVITLFINGEKGTSKFRIVRINGYNYTKDNEITDIIRIQLDQLIREY